MARQWGVLAAALLLLAASSTAVAQIVQVPEFTVGTGVDQLEAAVGADGNVVFIWSDRDDSPLYARWRLYTRAFTPAGTALGAAVRLDTEGRLYSPMIAALPGGGFLATFSHLTSFVHEIHARRLGAGGAADGDLFVVAADTDAQGSPYFSSIAVTASGPFVLWHEDVMWGRAYDFDLQPLGSVQPLSSGALQLSFGADSVAAGSGLAVVWDDLITPPALSAFDATGALQWSRNPFPGSAITARRVARGPDGQLAVAGDYAGKLYVGRFDAAGQPLGDPVLVAQDSVGVVYTQVDLEFDGGGDLLVVWSLTASPLRARILDHVTHRPLGAAVDLSPPRDNVRVARLLDGRFLVSSRFGSSGKAIVVAGCSALPSCGNHVVDSPCEQCDDGAANSDSTADACRSDCRAARCGDGVHDSGEECDDGNVGNHDGCDAGCLLESCGNGRREAGEGCDDANLVDDDGCDSTCEPTGCGSGVRTGTEECDDGNTDSGDGCDSACLVEDCGNARVEANEQCDDGNAIGGDGCENDCTFSPLIDAVVEPVAPLKLRLTGVASTAVANVLLHVRNADPAKPLTLRLSADEDTCPPGTILSPPDLDASQAGAQDSIVLPPGRRATAVMQVQATRAAFAPVHRRAPRRCTLQVTAARAGGGAFDEQPANNAVPIAVDVYDLAASASGAETYLKAIRPRTFTIANGALASEQRMRVRLRSTEPGSTLALTIDDGTCPPGALSLLSFDPDSGSARVLVRASRAFFTTPRSDSPGRCVASIRGSADPDADGSNDVVPFVMSVVDENDM